MREPRTVVVGAGLAGLTAALDIAETEGDVLVLEARDVVGGRTSSWNADGMAVESGLHRVLGFYQALPDLLLRCGVRLDDIVCWEDELEFRTTAGHRRVLGVAPLYRPIKTLLTPLATLGWISPADLPKLVPFFLSGLLDSIRRPDDLDQLSVLDLAQRWRLSGRTIERLLVPLTAGLFFVPPQRYSALNFFGLIRAALPKAYRARVGAYLGGMTEIMCDPIARAVVARGGEVVTGATVERLMTEGDRVTGVVVDGNPIEASDVVLATPLGPAQRLLRPAFADHDWLSALLAAPTTPSATLQLELYRPALDVDRTTFGPPTAMAGFSEQCRTTFRDVPGRLSVILSPPEEFLAMDSEDLLERVVADAERLRIPLRDRIARYRAVNLYDDFLSLEPGHAWRRPTQRTPIQGLTLAGDYTKQPFLSTMEGAILSGHAAAKVVLKSR